jgi:FkbM family methyltransferase
LKIDSLELFIDVGANIGTSCIPAVARGYAKRAIAIEPEPHNCRLLRANIALNGLDNRITVHESACGIQDNETLELALSDEDNIGDHQIRPDGGNGGRKTVKIQSNTLDTSCPDVCDGTLIWMDTQGYEGYVLAGAARWLGAGAPLVMEFAPYLMERNQSFELMKNALAQYASFHDLWRDWGEPERFHPIQGT